MISEFMSREAGSRFAGRKYLYFILAIIGLGFLVAIPLHAAESTLQITKNDLDGAYIYPGQWDIEVLDFTLTPAANDTLIGLTVMNKGNSPYSFIKDLTLYADDGDGIFEGWQKDIDLGKGVFGGIYGSQFWYWQNINTLVPKEGKRFFIAAAIVRDSSLTSDRKSFQVAILPLSDTNSDGLYDNLSDTGIYMASKNNGPVSEMVNSGIFTIAKTGFDSLLPVSYIISPVANAQLTSRAVAITGLAKDQGDGYIYDVYITIKNKLGDLLVNKAKANFTDLNTGSWEYNYTFNADGEYTVISQAIDGNSNLQTPGDSVTFTIGTAAPLPEEPAKTYGFGDLIKASGAAVYYYGHNGKRYVFPNLGTYLTWYSDFSTVKTITDAQLGAITIGGNVTYKPGVKLVKITTDPKVYAVGSGGLLQWVSTESIAVALYGANWADYVEDIPDPFFVNYFVGLPINYANEFSPERARNAATDISADKGLYPVAPIL